MLSRGETWWDSFGSRTALVDALWWMPLVGGPAPQPGIGGTLPHFSGVSLPPGVDERPSLIITQDGEMGVVDSYKGAVTLHSRTGVIPKGSGLLATARNEKEKPAAPPEEASSVSLSRSKGRGRKRARCHGQSQNVYGRFCADDRQ